MRHHSLKGTWKQAFKAFFFPIFLVLCVRWILVEPFVIPSGSMIPNLLIHDHLMVKKFSFGVKLPFTDYWLVKWNKPHRGEVVVFKYPKNPEVFFIKRLIGLPGDKISVQNGKVLVNNNEMPQIKLYTQEGFDYFSEDIEGAAHVMRLQSQNRLDVDAEWTVPDGQYFMMGDNRDESSDSRMWGFVPEKYLVGRAWVIWLSCDEMLQSSTYLCNPLTIRWDRLFKGI